MQRVNITAKFNKDHFVIVDAIGVEQSQKTDSRPLERAPGLSLKDVLNNIVIGQDTSDDMLTTLANRLIRLDRQINDKEKANCVLLGVGVRFRPFDRPACGCGHFCRTRQ